MLTARIKIGETGTIKDTREYGLVFLSADSVVAAPVKALEETSYPEQQGINICPKTVDDAFDYKVTFFMQATSIQTANSKITEFNNLIAPKQGGSDIRIFNRIEFYNDHKRQKIVGYPRLIPEAKTFWIDPESQVNDVIVLEMTIRVNKPSDCIF